MIHNFTQEIKVTQEYKVIEKDVKPNPKIVTSKRVELLPTKCKSKPVEPKPVEPKPVEPSSDRQMEVAKRVMVQDVELLKDLAKTDNLEPEQSKPTRYVESAEDISSVVSINKNNDQPKIKVNTNIFVTPQGEQPKPKHAKLNPVKHPKVYRLGDVYHGRRILMDNLGIDVGTKTIVVAYRNGEDAEFISEINGYYPFERCTPFIKNMLDDPNKMRSDGTKRPARWIEMDGKAVVLGRDAEEFAYAKNDTLLRPMAEGGISADEEAMTVLGAIVQGLMQMAEQEIGEFKEEVKVCYCTTAPAINKESNIDYHERVVNMVIDGYDTEAKLSRENIKESHAIVIDMSEDGTGIGISWGAGTVTVSYVKYGIEVYSFCWVGAGDWIDIQVAMRHGYDPDHVSTRKKKAKETPTTVAKKKQTVDLTPDYDYSDDRLAMDIVLHYDVLINKVIEGVVQGFEQNEAEARIEDAVPIFMAGGTSSPTGFVERCKIKLDKADPPFEVGEVLRSDNPLFTVATGCLKAAEIF
ncbi:hypothetical protein N9045_01590 [bacterium]|nr:hypothetical protein [bacterium]